METLHQIPLTYDKRTTQTKGSCKFSQGYWFKLLAWAKLAGSEVFPWRPEQEQAEEGAGGHPDLPFRVRTTPLAPLV